MEFKITIEYCPGCRWLLRSGWMAQELLSTFEQEINEVSLKPNKEVSGTFKITCNNNLIWCRKRDNGFPDIKELKKRIRDSVIPEKNLGHLDRS
ncbi:MAG: SelT/SelW/SelH family protein [Opitutae bacterium]|jgi:selenoprotein W-related protein|nr:SelT/SelW/SelH family protein [Opitutae bacterium]MBT5715878.1 SelT/SelW/SelH family protein [Opitutae bacterium]